VSLKHLAVYFNTSDNNGGALRYNSIEDFQDKMRALVLLSPSMLMMNDE
jgi:hypothetical protein